MFELEHGLKRRLMSTQVQTPPRAVLDATPEDVRSFPIVSFIHTAHKHADIIFGKKMSQLGSASLSSEATSCTMKAQPMPRRADKRLHCFEPKPLDRHSSWKGLQSLAGCFISL